MTYEKIKQKLIDLNRQAVGVSRPIVLHATSTEINELCKENFGPPTKQYDENGNEIKFTIIFIMPKLLTFDDGEEIHLKSDKFATSPFLEINGSAYYF